MDWLTAERALHDRARQEFAAAVAAGLLGEFRAFTVAGLNALLTTSPGLGFLNAVTGLTAGTVGGLSDLLDVYTTAGAPPPSLVISAAAEPAVQLTAYLRRLGFRVAGSRPVAMIDLERAEGNPASALAVTEAVTETERAVFLDTLAAGYGAEPRLARFIRTGHAGLALRCFIAWQGDQPVAAAAYSHHGSTAVLGGAATRPDARGSGAQTALLRHRLSAAAAAGAVVAAATAAPGSPSSRNLDRAGFTLCERQGWIY